YLFQKIIDVPELCPIPATTPQGGRNSIYPSSNSRWVSYVLAVVTGKVSRNVSPVNIIIETVGVSFQAAFILPELLGFPESGSRCKFEKIIVAGEEGACSHYDQYCFFHRHELFSEVNYNWI